MTDEEIAQSAERKQKFDAIRAEAKASEQKKRETAERRQTLAEAFNRPNGSAELAERFGMTRQETK